VGSGVPDVFLSYNREDQAVARRFAEAFEREGFSVWWDVGLKTGEAYDQVTEKALREAKAVVVLWSKRSVESRWVRAEATLADRNKTLVPCMIEPCERPIMFELTQTAELGHWAGDAGDRVWSAFLGDVRRFVGNARLSRAAPASASALVDEAVRYRERGGAPSLALLPFTNRSGLKEDDVFALGMVEDVVDALSQSVNVRVLASTATASFRKEAITDLAAVGRQLGVRYLLEGNVRRSGPNLRVSAQLVEAGSGAILWTQKFDRPLSELAALQEDLVLEVAAHLDSQVHRLEMERALRKPADLTAWEALTRAISSFRQLRPEDVAFGIEEAQRAVAIDPDYAAAQAMLALQWALDYVLFKPDDPEEVKRIRWHADRAVSLEPDNPVVLGFVAQALNMIGQPQEALLRSQRAIRLSPNYGYAHFVQALSCTFLNRPDEALEHLDIHDRTAPGSSLQYIDDFFRGYAHMRAGDLGAAIAAFDHSTLLNPEPGFGYVYAAE